MDWRKTLKKAAWGFVKGAGVAFLTGIAAGQPPKEAAGHALAGGLAISFGEGGNNYRKHRNDPK